MPWVRGAQAQQFAGKELRVLTWSDPTGRAAVRNILQPFEAETGAKVIADLTGTTSEMIAKIKASASRPQYDLVILGGYGGTTLAEAGLLEEPSWDLIPNSQNLFPQYRSGAKGFGVGYYLWSDGLLFNTSTFEKPPTSYNVLWGDKAKGRVIAQVPQSLGAMELIIVAAKVAGGSAEKPDPGFKLLKELKSQVVMLSNNSTQISELFRANSVSAGAVYGPLLFANFIPDPKYKVSATYDLAEGFFTDLQLMVIPKGHPGDRTVISALMNKALDPTVQAKMAEEVWYGPINMKTVLSEKTKALPYIPSPDLISKKAITLDPAYLAAVREEWTRRYIEAIA
jgi:putative spermidine/putrescine transport system substrate-binding protein